MFYQWKLSTITLIVRALQWPWICASVICAPWSRGGISKACLNWTLPESVWTGDLCEVLCCLTKSLKRNKYSLSHNISKLSRKERISGDIAAVIALQPNQWCRSTFMNMIPSVMVLCLVCVEQHPHKYSWNSAEYDAWQSYSAVEKQWVIQTLYWHKHHCLSFKFEQYFDLLITELSLISFIVFSPIFITWVTSVARRSE